MPDNRASTAVHPYLVLSLGAVDAGVRGPGAPRLGGAVEWQVCALPAS